MIQRTLAQVAKPLAKQYPVLTITGPRQSGKTTLCRHLFPKLPYVNLEAWDTREFADEDPRSFLLRYSKGAILDEFQHSPQLASYLQEIVDDPKFKGLFVLTGSQNLSLTQTVTQSLAGRTAVLSLLPLSLKEVLSTGQKLEWEEQVFKGFYPRIYNKNLSPVRAMNDYIATYLEKDIRNLKLVKNLKAFNMFIRCCAGRISQLLKLQSLGSDVGVSQTTAKEWKSLLEASYVTFTLPGFYKNIGKRLIKMPKVYFYDTGLACRLLGIEKSSQIETHPLKGALFENFIVCEFFKNRYNMGLDNNLYFLKDSNNNEVDLFFQIKNHFCAVEIKSSRTIDSSFFSNLEKTDKFLNGKVEKILIYAGDKSYVSKGVQVFSFKDLNQLFKNINL